MKLLIAASEAVPYAKTGGLADVTGALPQELVKLGHDIILVLPRYRSLEQAGRTFRVVARVAVPTPQGSTEAVVEEDVVAVPGCKAALRVWAVRQDRFFDRDGLYQEQGRDYPDNLERFSWFSRAIVEIAAFLSRRKNWKADILHLHDWQTALCAVYLKTTDRDRVELQGTRTVLTLHNVGYQGIFSGNRLNATGLPVSVFSIDGLEFYGSLNLLKGGINFADYLTTVSPTYAKEILTPEFGFGLEGVLRMRQESLKGIINGIDTECWNPASDHFLPASYSVGDLSGKQICKRSLQQEFGLPAISVPVLAVIARLTSQKGLDLLEAIIPQLMEEKLQLIVLGTGDSKHEEGLKRFRDRFPSRIGLHIGFDEGLAHRIEGGADIFVMPSRYEPCGLSQLYSLRYGTVPVVARTGGLVDTVVPMNPETLRVGRATGFHVEAATSESLLNAVRAATGTYAQESIWKQLIHAGMNTDVSWGRSARIYDAIFADVANGKKIGGY